MKDIWKLIIELLVWKKLSSDEFRSTAIELVQKPWMQTKKMGRVLYKNAGEDWDVADSTYLASKLLSTELHKVLRAKINVKKLLKSLSA